MYKFAAIFVSVVLAECCVVAYVSGVPARAGKKSLANTESIIDVINEIKKDQGVDNVFLIDPDKVNDRLLEKTGEALIKNMPPNPREHEIFDSFIIGKKELSSLNVVHRFMGYHYLTGDFYGGPGNLYGPSLLCNQAVSEPIKTYSFIAFSAGHLALLWFLIIALAITNIYLLCKNRTLIKQAGGGAIR